MAEAAKKKSFRLPRGVRRASLKPQGKGGGFIKALGFSAEAEDDSTENDFDAILQEVMANNEKAPHTQLTDEDSEAAAALARRLADRVLKAREEDDVPVADDVADPLAEAKKALEAAKAQAAAAPVGEVSLPIPDEAADDDAELAEPADFAKLIQAREAMMEPPQQSDGPDPIKNEGRVDAKNVLRPFDRDEDTAAKPALKAFEKEPLGPAPLPSFRDDAPVDPRADLRPLPEEAGPENGPGEDDFTAALLALGDGDDDLIFADDDSSGSTPSDGGDGSTPALRADPRPQEEMKPAHLRNFAEAVTPMVIWLSLAMVVGSLIYGAWVGGVDIVVATLFGGGLLTFATVLTVAGATKAYSPVLMTSFLLKRTTKPKNKAAVLAGGTILETLRLAEGIIDADADARLVTTKDGVVVYANDAYLRIAEEAGVRGATGLPPRIDRLFGQSGTESSKMFRLAKACRSAEPAEEVMTQAMGRAARGSQGELPLRRFSVQVRPMRPSGDGEAYASWRLHELQVDKKTDELKTAYHNFPRPVIAVERSGSLAWLNLKAAKLFGTKPGQPLSLGDVVLGEVKPLVGHLWQDVTEEYEARIRQRGQASVTASQEVVLLPFAKGGPGEGFVCVEVIDKSGMTADPMGMQVGADLTDAPFGVAVLEGDPAADAKISYANNLFTSFFTDATEGARFSNVLSAQALGELVAALRTKPNQKPLTKPIEVRIGEGAAAHTFRLFARPVRRRRGAYGPRQTVLYAVDITYQRRMEEESIQAQKLQQIGQIAGSVAHDFNNLLVVVMGSTELLMRNHPVGDPSYKDLALIYETSQRAQNLTRNLLAFSRKQTLKPEVCSVTELLNDFTPALKRYVSEKVSLNVVHGRNVPEIKADKGQIHLAIMNLAVNARDAMPGGGSLNIETKHVLADDIADYGYEVLEEVDHVLIEVADTGSGVPAEHADHIFEPFYTTKGEGQGTGLGLSTVAGAIAQMGGRIFLFNRPGEGATFRIFLPAVTPEEAKAAQERRNTEVKVDETTDPTGKGRILVVEDEDGVRSIVVRALSMCGYEIVEASDGDEALDLIEDTKERFDLVLTDIMMPEMDGPTLIEEAGDKLRGAKVIFMSGYAEAAMREKLNTIEGAKYLQKPFTLTSVAAVVKESLASR